MKLSAITTTPALTWWLFLCLQVLGLGVAYSFGVHTMISTADATTISWWSLGLYGLTTIFVGYRTLIGNPRRLEPSWFISDLLQGLGLLGTLLGFIIMLGTVFAGIDPSKVETMRQALA